MEMGGERWKDGMVQRKMWFGDLLGLQHRATRNRKF